MSPIDELIARHCPSGVEFRALGEIARIRTGERPPGGFGGEGDVPIFNGGVQASGWTDASNTPAGTITIPSRGSVGVVGYQFEPFWCGPLCYRIVGAPDAIATRFLYYALKSQERAIIALQQTGSIPALNKKEIIRLRLPVPPEALQVEIVRVLDSFTELESELERELNARRQQYAHYRDRLLTFRELA